MTARRLANTRTDQADGMRLILRTDGSICHLDRDGATGRTWGADDPEWASLARLFRVRVEPETDVPSGRGAEATRPPRR